MTELPPIGSTHLLKMMGSEDTTLATVAAYEDNKIVVILLFNNGVKRADIFSLHWFNKFLVKPEPVKEEPAPYNCLSAGILHCYVQARQTHQSKAFCTQCGHILLLD